MKSTKANPGVLIVTAFLLAMQGGCLIAGDRVALVVGVDQYDFLPKAAQLDVAVSDARQVADTLKELNPAFEVMLLENVSQREADDALDAFVESAENAECALVYFAGHGIEFHGENFLLMSDTELESPSPDVNRMKRRLGKEALSLQILVDELEATNAQVKVVILDACRNNPLELESPNGTRSVVGNSKGLAQVVPPSGTLISYSADAGQAANDGLFTGVLVKHLKTPGLPLPHVFAATREEVRLKAMKLAEQNEGVYHEPAEYTKLNLSGMNFSFLPGEPMPTAPTTMAGHISQMTKILRERLGDPNLANRSYALRDLKKFPTEILVRLGSPLLRDPEAFVRGEAAQALAKVRAQLKGKDLEAFQKASEELIERYSAPNVAANERFALALFFFETGDLKGAEDTYRLLLTANPDHIKARINLAEILHSNGDTEEAEQEVRKGLAAAKSNEEIAIARDSLARILIREKKYEEGLAELALAVELDPENAQIHYFYGVALNQMSTFREALPFLEKAHALDPMNTEYLIGLSTICRDGNDRVASLKYAKRALELEPTNSDLQAYVASLEK